MDGWIHGLMGGDGLLDEGLIQVLDDLGHGLSGMVWLFILNKLHVRARWPGWPGCHLGWKHASTFKPPKFPNTNRNIYVNCNCAGCGCVGM